MMAPVRSNRSGRLATSSVLILLCLVVAGLLAFQYRGFLGWQGVPTPSNDHAGAASQARRTEGSGGASEPPLAGPGEASRAGKDQEDGEAQAIAENELTKLRILIPAYIHPSGTGLAQWTRLFDAATRVPLVMVVNPNTGPGTELDQAYVTALEHAARRNVVTIGYISTKHGERPLETVKLEIEAWIRMYPQIRGFFLDAQAKEGDHIGYYESISNFARERLDKALIVTNPGTVCDERYLDKKVTDLACLFSAPQGFDQFGLPLWSANHSPKNFSAMPYAVATQDKMIALVKYAVERKIGYLYVTDMKEDKAWTSLPSYWDQEVEAVRRVNQKQMP